METIREGVKNGLFNGHVRKKYVSFTPSLSKDIFRDKFPAAERFQCSVTSCNDIGWLDGFVSTFQYDNFVQ